MLVACPFFFFFWIKEKSPNEPNEEWPSVFHRDAQEEDENGKWVLNLVSYDL
jgi:hypothetical protein